MSTLRNALALGVAAILAAATLGGCVSNPSADKPVAGGPVFYPPPPAAPRIQYLTTIASERDVAGPRDDFADFILGDDAKTQRLTQPYGVALHQGRLYVADTGAGGLAIFDLGKGRYEFFTGQGNGRLKKPINIRIDADGTKYVTDTGRDQVLVYGPDDRFLAAFGTEGQFRPVDLAIAGDRLYVTDILHHQVQVLDKRSGALLFKFGKAGSGEGELYHPTNIAIGADGDLYVVETSNFRVQRFTPAGKSVRIYGAVGNTPGSFARPKGIAIDRAGRMYVGDAAFQNVQVFDRDGKLLMFFGQGDDPATSLNLPAGMAIDYDNVAAFRAYAAPKFHVEYLILVASQFGPNKVDVFGFGRMDGADYAADSEAGR